MANANVMFSSIEAAVEWAQFVLGGGVRVGTYVPRDAEGLPTGKQSLCLVDRTGGTLNFPHDFPEITFQVWTKSEAESEELANVLAIACKTAPPTDPHINSIQPPTLSSYGNQGAWFVWQVSVSWGVRLDD